VKRYRKTLQYTILALMLLIGGYAIGNSLFASSAALKAGDRPPAFKLLGLDGSAHDLQDYKGKPLIVNFWGTWCPPCRDEIPAFQAVYEKWKDKGIALVGINLSEDRISVQNFAHDYGANFPILLDRNKMTQNKYGLKQFPTTFFIYPNGTIEDIVIGGPLTQQQIETHIDKLLQTKS
jgi:peroxiredoxin